MSFFRHGCPQCHPKKDNSTPMTHPHTKETMSELYRKWLLKEKCIIDSGYTLIVMWEHEFIELKRDDEKFKLFCETSTLLERLDPRDSFKGGRTSAICVNYSTLGTEEKIHYYDFTSLYPWVNKYGIYPIGHPNIITSIFTHDINHYFGLIKLEILPPRGLYHPVLPIGSGGKLLFPLCNKCAQLMNQTTVCSCTDSERTLTGTWTTLEVSKAVEKGSIIYYYYF